jgi:putative ABC transport system ATP-binding protein
MSGTSRERIALRGVNFTVQDGEVVSLLGNSGCGRSTLLRFLAGHISSNFGRLWMDKIDISVQTLSQRSEIFSSVFYDENTGTAANLTVGENLAAANQHHRSRSIFRSALTAEMKEIFTDQLKALDFMGMEELTDEKAGNISRPQRQVLAMLIAVIKEAKVLLIDEHSTGLDPTVAANLLETTEKIIRSKNITAIMAINDPKFALEVSDRIIVLSHGHVVADLSGNEKKNTKLEDLFTLFNVMPGPIQIKQPKLI